MPEITDARQAADRLAAARTIVALGVSSKSHKAGFYVPDYLHGQGYHVIPVNPRLAGQVMWGQTVRGSLAEVDEEVDMVDVFRRAELLPGHLPELLALGPKLVWFQLGIVHDQVAKALVDAGIDVVQSRCTLADHRAFGLPSVD